MNSNIVQCPKCGMRRLRAITRCPECGHTASWTLSTWLLLALFVAYLVCVGQIAKELLK